ncbi:MAG: NADH-quinone oxidoreductase subunit NuoH [Anaerolineae bacterium]
MDYIANLFPNIAQSIQDALKSLFAGWGLAPDAANVLTFFIWALVVITVLLILGPVVMMYMTWIERKWVARLQDRIGPNRVGPFGLLQPIADMIKFIIKEDIVPASADKFLHTFAPIAVVIPVVMAFAVVPWGKQMAAVDLNVGILYILAAGSLGTIGIFAAGFGSNNKFALVGAMRAIAQIVSYEIPQVLAISVVVLLAGSLSLTKIVQAQSGGGTGLGWFLWFIPVGPIAFIVYLIAATAEVNRVPFDLPEAESELVAGYHTEYSGMKFGMFYLAEFLNTFIISLVGASLFLGGWQGPFVDQVPLLGVLYFSVKVFLLVVLQPWLRGTLPRIRVDQLMNLAWKVLVPITLVLLVLTPPTLFVARLLGYQPPH